MTLPELHKRYHLRFENSEAGQLECADCPLEIHQAECVDVDETSMTFRCPLPTLTGVKEEGEEPAYEEISFFLHSHKYCAYDGQWWDDNYWTRLVELTEEPA